MATYKVPQDVEAEDKLLGPFSLRQFIYLIIVAICLWLIFIFARNTFTLIFIPLALAPALFFGLLVFLGVKNQSQPAESYLAALVRFYFKPHKRLWNQDGVMETVHITAPVRVARQYSDNLTKVEVKSHLDKLADLMDSRGWAAKDVRFQPNIVLPTTPTSDERLIALNQLPVIYEPTDVHAQDDVMDETANAVAQSFGSMLQTQQQQHRDQAVAHMSDPSYDPYPADMRQHVVQPIDEDDDQPHKAAAKLKKSHVKKHTKHTDTPKPTQPDPALLSLIQNNDLSVQTLASQAQRLKTLESGEEISLH